MIQLPIDVAPKITLSSYLHYRVILLRNLHIINPHCLHKIVIWLSKLRNRPRELCLQNLLRKQFIFIFGLQISERSRGELMKNI
jgi:hypothetical protein